MDSVAEVAENLNDAEPICLSIGHLLVHLRGQHAWLEAGSVRNLQPISVCRILISLNLLYVLGERTNVRRLVHSPQNTTHPPLFEELAWPVCSSAGAWPADRGRSTPIRAPRGLYNIPPVPHALAGWPYPCYSLSVKTTAQLPAEYAPSTT